MIKRPVRTLGWYDESSEVELFNVMDDAGHVVCTMPLDGSPDAANQIVTALNRDDGARIAELEAALGAIHYIVGSDFGMAIEGWERDDKLEHTLRVLENAQKAVSGIYKIAHSEISSCTTHDDWKQVKYKVLKDFTSHELADTPAQPGDTREDENGKREAMPCLSRREASTENDRL